MTELFVNPAGKLTVVVDGTVREASVADARKFGYVPIAKVHSNFRDSLQKAKLKALAEGVIDPDIIDDLHSTVNGLLTISLFADSDDASIQETARDQLADMIFSSLIPETDED